MYTRVRWCSSSQLLDRVVDGLHVGFLKFYKTDQRIVLVFLRRLVMVKSYQICVVCKHGLFFLFQTSKTSCSPHIHTHRACGFQVHGLCIYGPQARVLFWTLDYNPDIQTFAHELLEMFSGGRPSLSCTVPGLCSILWLCLLTFDVRVACTLTVRHGCIATMPQTLPLATCFPQHCTIRAPSSPWKLESKIFTLKPA